MSWWPTAGVVSGPSYVSPSASWFARVRHRDGKEKAHEMDKLSKLTPGAMLTLGGLVLYVINSFLPWPKLCVGDGDFRVCASQSEWNGIAVPAGLLGIG